MPRQISFFAPDQVSPLNPAAYALQQYGARRTDPLAATALQAGTSMDPVQSPLEGISRVGQALLGGYLQGDEQRRGRAAGDRMAQAIIGAMPEAQRTGPQGQALMAALSDPDTRATVLPQLLQSMTRTQQAPEGYRMRPDGSVEPIPGGPADPDVQRRTYLTAHPITEAGGVPYDTSQLLGGAAGPGGGGGAAVPGTPTQTAQAQLRQSESGGNPAAVGPEIGGPGTGTPRAMGTYQFMPDTWAGVARAHPELGLTPQGISDPQQQERAFQAHAGDILRQTQGLVGRQVNGATITPEALIRGAWMGGIDGVRRYVESNGQVNPRDINGMSVGDYVMGTARNLPQTAALPGAQGGGGLPGVSRMPAPPMGTGAPSRLPGQAVPGALPMGQGAPPGSQPVQLAQAGGATATDAQAAPPLPPVTDLIPDARGGTAAPILPPDPSENLVLRQPRGALTSGPTQQQIQSARAARQEHFSQPEVRNALRVTTVLRSMEETAGRDSAASDLNMVYGLMTILDPSSVVREGEVSMVNRTQGVPQWLMGMYDRISSGGAVLQPQDRQRIMTEARSRAAAQLETYRGLRRSEDTFLRSSNLNPAAVLGEAFTLPPARPPPAAAAPTTGTPAPAVPGQPALSDVDAEIARRRQQGGR